MALATLYIVVDVWPSGASLRGFVYGVAAFWAVLPPVWFWFEYYYLYKRHGAVGTFELFKHGQQTAVAIWAGIALSLVAVASSDNFKDPPECPKSAALKR